MLTADAGTRLRELLTSADDLARWEEVLPPVRGVQLAAAAGRRAACSRSGCPTTASPGFAARFEQRARRPRRCCSSIARTGSTPASSTACSRACPRSSASAPSSPRTGSPRRSSTTTSTTATSSSGTGEYVLFDWGDSCVSHPFHTLAVTLRAIAWRFRPRARRAAARAHARRVPRAVRRLRLAGRSCSRPSRLAYRARHDRARSLLVPLGRVRSGPRAPRTATPCPTG